MEPSDKKARNTGFSLLVTTVTVVAVVATVTVVAACTQSEKVATMIKYPTFSPENHLYLEKIEGKQALDDVRRWNSHTLKSLENDPRYQKLYNAALEIATSNDRIPYGHIRDNYLYNFWQDETYLHGLWRRTTLDSYARQNPDWEILLDLDALAEQEQKNWVFKGAKCNANTPLCMIALSNGGKDAIVQREFNTLTKSFVKQGFSLPEAKSSLVWVDKDTLLVSTDWGENSLTEAGYPYILKLWQRGQSLQDAREIMRGQKQDVGLWPYMLEDQTSYRLFGAVEADSFFSSQHWLFNPDFSAKPRKIPIPHKSSVHGMFDGWILISLEQDWQSFLSGDLIALNANSFLSHTPLVHLLYSPQAQQAIDDVSISAGAVLISLNDNVARRIITARRASGNWKIENLPLPERGSASIHFASPREKTALIGYEDFLTPDTLSAYDSSRHLLKPLKSLPAWFRAENYQIQQLEALSSDNTPIPYYLISPKQKSVNSPVLLYGYGGFQVSLNPAYSGNIGRLWLEQGGAYALANIRGGGEFGPQWHQAGLKTKRQIVYDDFIAVAENLIEQKFTSPEKLAIMGGSNGGLLMGVMYTQRPDLWKALVCQVPLLDMLRYHKLLAGASWVDEYGSPDVPEERKWLQKISPYHNIDPQTEHPEIFFLTSTRDDRVHPAHARKMAKRLEELGKPFLYYENINGGHSAAANRKEAARRRALEFTWLAQKLIDSP